MIEVNVIDSKVPIEVGPYWHMEAILARCPSGHHQ